MDCNKCAKLKKQCSHPSGNWFSYGDIRFCLPQVLWYLANSEGIGNGEWPKDPEGSSYTDPAIRSKAVRIPSKAAEELYAEMECRLNLLPGIERKLLETEVGQEKSLAEFSPYSITCLNFISGFRRRIASCTDCGGWTVLVKGKNGYTQTCEKCGKSWGHLSFSLWKRQRKYLDKH